jgi:hypothetical protein
MITYDFWYGDTKEDITGADCTFYPNYGEYRGNLYKGTEVIGDYVSDSSVDIAKELQIVFI